MAARHTGSPCTHRVRWFAFGIVVACGAKVATNAIVAHDLRRIAAFEIEFTRHALTSAVEQDTNVSAAILVGLAGRTFGGCANTVVGEARHASRAGQGRAARLA